MLRPQCWEALGKAAVPFLKRQDEGYLSGRRALPIAAWAPAWGLTLTKKALRRKCQGLGGQLGLGLPVHPPTLSLSPLSDPHVSPLELSLQRLPLTPSFSQDSSWDSLPLLPVSRPAL